MRILCLNYSSRSNACLICSFVAVYVVVAIVLVDIVVAVAIAVVVKDVVNLILCRVCACCI